MAVDEFGREILGGRGGGDRRREDSPPPPRNSSGGPLPPGEDFLNQALPTSRYDGEAGAAPHHHSHHTNHAGGSHHHMPMQMNSSRDNTSRHRYHDPPSHHQQHRHHHNRDRDAHPGSHHHSLVQRQDDQHHNRKRKNREEDGIPSGPPSSLHRGRNHSSHHHPKSSPHPFTLYADEPMLCQFLWKESKDNNENNNDENDADREELPASPPPSDAVYTASDEDIKPSKTTSSNSNSNSSSPSYDEYRKGYCLNYIRMFFNQHMDDSWFRSMYSPLEEQRLAVQERTRAAKEAQAFGKELEASMAKNAASSGPCFFVLKARLGGGIKQSSTAITTSPSSSRHYHSSNALSNPVPGTHVMSVAHQILPIQDVPPHVTDEQLIGALLAIPGLGKDLLKSIAATTSTSSTPLQLFSSSVPGNGNLFRTVFVQCPTEEIRKEIISQLVHVDRASAAATAATSTKDAAAAAAEKTHVPRKEDTYIPKLLPLEVECSDAYGRTEVDADGKGGAGVSEGGVPPRKETVWVSTTTHMSAVTNPQVSVLSAAVSSKEHIPSDMKAARKLAQAYDIRRNIPLEDRLESILTKALDDLKNEDNDSQSQHTQTVEDALDLAIAYLRRVHLFSFYHGCACAHRVGDVWNGTHPASTIHLRLGLADEILQQASLDEVKVEGERAKVVDLLVQRHELSISKALNEAQPWLDDPAQWSRVILSPEKDSMAKSIVHEENQVEPAWIDNHAVIDEDERARCSFHFCRKLFKDYSFLKKHLLKKHSEFLKAERAKCHDQSMMEAWDAQEQRPVPPILVDCGRAFSLVPSPVLGADIPLAEDPEPELWRKQEERRQEEDQMRRERQERFQPPPPPPSLNMGDVDGPLLEERSPHLPLLSNSNSSAPPRQSNFFDVDDMKEEKIELAFFDTVEIPMPPKKKRKKKLL